LRLQIEPPRYDESYFPQTLPHDIVVPASEEIIMTDDTGTGAKKETVYSGPTPALENAGWAQKAAQGTVYQGPSQAGTVFDENKFVAKKTDNTMARQASVSHVRRATWRFFRIAIFNLVELAIFWSARPEYAAFCGVVSLVFFAIGAFAYRLNRPAFLAGFGIYVLQTLWLLFIFIALLALPAEDTGMMGMFLFRVVAIALVARSIIVYRLWIALGHLNDLLAEA
jgi:hypothetical protein